jgi:membrane protease YdiL (CAAX protease family)
MSADPDRRARARFAVVAIGAAVIAHGLVDVLFRFGLFWTFYPGSPLQVGEMVLKTLWVGVALAALMVAHRTGVVGALRQAGLVRSPGRAIGVAAIAVAPVAAVFVWLFPFNPALSLIGLWMTAIVRPVSEEVLLRGVLFAQLHRRAGWPFAVAVLVSIEPYVCGHLLHATAGGALAGAIAVNAIRVTRSAGLAWLLVRWDYNLWLVIALHALVDLTRYVFAVDPFGVNVASQIVVLAIAVGITIHRRGLDASSASPLAITR